MSLAKLQERGELAFDRADGPTLLVRLGGKWCLNAVRPSAGAVERELESSQPRQVSFDTARLEDWDSAILTFLNRVIAASEGRGVAVDRQGLPIGVQKLLSLAEAVPEKKDARTEAVEPEVLERIGLTTLSAQASVEEIMHFLGEVVVAFGRFLVGKARFRRHDLWLLIQQAGAEALPIVTLVSFLLGLILAFVGAIQLQTFGATIYVANLVGVAMVRDMAALMTGIIMAGRSGAAYAAQLGSMQVNQEIDALATMGISPIEFLVLPRVLALSLMMPLLTLYADFVGILGGVAVGTSMLDLSFITYMQQTAGAVSLEDLVVGLFKGGTYGVLVAIAGGLRGMQSGRSSSGVGDAATAAVVTGIVSIIAAAGLFAFLFYVLGL